MKLLLAAALLATSSATLTAAPPAAHHPKAKATHPPRTEGANKSELDQPSKPFFKPSETRSTGTVTVGGQPIAFDAIAGTLVVHAKEWEDTDAAEADADKSADKSKNAPKPEASMFYTAYFRQGVPTATRPITFLFNGGPGSSTVWLHMGAFGPVRVVTADARHTPRPLLPVNNDQSLLDASDLVFIDAPGTGFSRVAGKDKEKAFYGVDQDIHAFTDFITQFLTKYGRWKSPKYVFGESYGTMRGAGLALSLQNADVDLNGVILLSGILNWDVMPDDPQLNPGYRHAVRRRAPDLCGDRLVLQQGAEPPRGSSRVPRAGRAFATGDYAHALMQGQRPAGCGAATDRAAAARLHGIIRRPIC